MTIKNLDDLKNLFLIKNFYPQELLDNFASVDHLSTAWKKQDMQDQYPRRKLLHDPGSIYEKFDQYVKNQLDMIGQTIGIELMAADTVFWLDEAGFCMAPHIDNAGVAVSMQIYLNTNNPNLGTVFYNPANSVRLATEYKLNQGYLMINGPDQMHGMNNPVPINSYRISSYSLFYPKV